jgi:hypothetical protein
MASAFQVLGDKQPNRAHEALVELERQGLLDAVVTQNIDMLHRKAGTKDLTSTSPTDAQPTASAHWSAFPVRWRRSRLRAQTAADDGDHSSILAANDRADYA